MLTLFHRETEGTAYREVDTFTEQQANDIAMSLNLIGTALLADGAPISQFIFSQRAENVLKRCGIQTLKQLSVYTRPFPGAGIKTFEEFKTVLDAHGLPWPAEMNRHPKLRSATRERTR